MFESLLFSFYLSEEWAFLDFNQTSLGNFEFADWRDHFLVQAECLDLCVP